MVEDGCGRGRAIFYAFVRCETQAILTKMLAIFAEFMGESIDCIKFAMTDKDNNEIASIKSVIPNAINILCAFHVHKAMKLKIHKMKCDKLCKERLHQLAYVLVTTNDEFKFNDILNQIKSLSSVFYLYLENN